MGEIIVRPFSSTPLPFTGERLTSALTGQTEIEHLHRYLVARELCRGKDVLDVASGEGYGTALMAQVARTTIGVEIAEEAVAHAAASYQASNLQFLQGDARAMPVADASADVVVSFETIEHFAEQEVFVSEIRRVLRPGGLLIVSTPDRDNYSPAESPANPYHVKEMTEPEFISLLTKSFVHCDYLAQRPMLGSVMLPARRESASSGTSTCFEKRGPQHFEASTGLARPQYLVAVCSDRQIAPLVPTVYIETSRLGYRTPEELEMQLSQVRHEVAELTEAASAYRSAQESLSAARAELASAHGELARRAAECAAVSDELACVRAQLAQRAADRAGLETELDLLRTESARQGAECKSLEHSNDMAEQAFAFARRELSECQRELSECRERCGHQELALHELGQAANDLRARGDLILASTSWRVTAPLRKVSSIFRRDRR